MKRPMPIPPLRALNDDEGQSTTQHYTYLKSLEDAAQAAYTDVEALKTERDIITVEFVQNKTYQIDISATFAKTISKIYAYCGSGSCTATFYIGGVALGGGANSVTTSLSSVTHTTDNAVPLGGNFYLTVTANASCQDMVLQVEYRRP